MKTSEMTENSAPAAGDWLIVTDSAYTATQKATLQNLWEAVAMDKGIYYSAGDIAAAVTAIGSTVCDLIVDESETVSGDLTVPENIRLLRVNGAILTVASGVTLTVNNLGPVGNSQFFAGDGTVELPAEPEINAAWFLTAGQPDGTTDNSADVQKAITALPSTGGEVVLPQLTSSSYKFNVTIPANTILRGVAPQKTKVGPYTDADPVVAVTGVRVAIRNINFDGAGEGVSDYAIRHNRALDGAGGGLLIEDCRFDDFTYGIDINNNYYNVIQRNTFDDVTYGIRGRNAFNRNTIRDNKFTGFDYAIAVLYDPAVDTYRSHGNTIQDNSFESPNPGGIAEYYYNSGGHLSLHNYYEGFSAASAWPVLEAGGPIVGWHTGSGDEAFLVDSAGRDFVKLGVAEGMTVYNKTDGSSATVTTIENGNAINDKITMTLSGGSGDDWDVDDYFLIDVDTTTEFRGGNTFQNPHCNSQADAYQLLEGVNTLVSSIFGSWTVTETGTLSYNKVSGQAITGGTPYEVDLTAQLSGYSRIALGKVKISYTFVNSSGAAGYLTFRPVGGGANDYYAYQNFDASSTVSETLEIPLSPDNRFWFHSTKSGTLTIKMHGILRE
jgi:hypothetical protein